MVFSYDYGKRKKGRQKTNSPLLLAILMASAACQSNTEDSIAQWGMTRTTWEATGCCYRATTCSISPQWPPGQQQTKQQQKMDQRFWPF
jgi:hypothetical protein